MEFSRQQYWSGVPFPTPGDLPNPGIEPHLMSPALAGPVLYDKCHLGSPWFDTRVGKSQVLRANASGKDLLMTWDQWEEDLDISVVEEKLMEASLKVGEEGINLLWKYKQLQGVERGLKSCAKRKYEFQQLMESQCWEVVDEECKENHINSCCLLWVFFFLVQFSPITKKCEKHCSSLR